MRTGTEVKNPKPHTYLWHLRRRDRDMQSARNWQAHYRNSGDKGCLSQMQAWVDAARRHNHFALDVRKVNR